MKRLLPFIVAVAAYFIARQVRPTAAAGVAQEAPLESKGDRTELRGLERRARQLAKGENSNPAQLESLFRSGSFSIDDRWDLIRRSAEKDPEGTWAWIDEQDLSDGDLENFRKIVAQIWFPRDPQAVLSRLRVPNYRDACVAGSLVGLLSSKDPKAVAAVRNHLDALVTVASLNSYGLSLPKPEEGGGELLLSLPAGAARDILTGSFATSWLKNDVSAARAWMENLPPAQREEVMATFVTQSIRPNSNATPETRALAAAWIEKDANPANRARLGPALAEWMAGDDPAAAFAWASENLSAAPLTDAMAKVSARLFTQDPDEARRIVGELPPGNLRHQAAAEVAKAWAASDPAAAVEWWTTQVDPAEVANSNGMTSGYALGQLWARKDLDSFRARLADPSQPPLPASLLSPAVDQWMKRDATGTLDWLSTLPPERRDDVAKSAFRSWAYDAPAAAAAGYLAHPELAPPAAARSIASAWFSEDREAAITWVAGLPEGPGRVEALAVLKKQADFEVQLGGSVPERLQKLLR